MAKPGITSMVLYSALLISLFLAASQVEGRTLGLGLSFRFGVPVKCLSVHGVASGETCFAVSRQFNLSDAQFFMINPNLDCGRLFVGQWLCVRGALRL